MLVNRTELLQLKAPKCPVLQLVQEPPIALENSARVWNVFVESYKNKKILRLLMPDNYSV